MNAARISIGIVCTLASIWGLVVSVVAVRSYFLMFRPRPDTAEAGRSAAVEQDAGAGAFLALDWEELPVRSPAGYDLAAFALPAAPRAGAAAAPAAAGAGAAGDTGSAAGTAIFVHGFTASRFNMLKYARPFHDRGWNTVVYDLAGHGDTVAPRARSRAPSFGFYEKDDLAAVVAASRSRFPGEGPVVVVGESMGAATVLQYAPLAAPADSGRADWAVDAVVADCPYSSAAEELDWRLKEAGVPRFVAGSAAGLVSLLLSRLRGFRTADAAPARSILETAVPILFIHGADDRYVPTAMSLRMAEERRLRGAGPTELLVVAGARHAQSVLVDPDAWFSIVFAFIDRYARGGNDS